MGIIGHMAERRRRDAVREAYESMGIDRQELARRTEIPPSTITNVIAGNPLSRHAAARIGNVIGWAADEVLLGERIIEREPEREPEHVSPEPLKPARPSDEPTHPPNKRDSSRVGAT